MKRKIVITVISLIICGKVYSQIDTTSSKIDTTRNKIIYSWNYSLKNNCKICTVDTLFTNFQCFNSLYNDGIRDEYLGNLGSARNTRIFNEKNLNSDFVFNEAFFKYFKKSDNVKYYNTKRPFTNLEYSSGGSKKTSEQTLGVLHTQNVNDKLNVGLDYNLISSIGSYSNQKLVGNFLSLFASYINNKYSVHANFNINNISQNENGGIDSLSLLSNSNFETINIPVKLNDDAISKIQRKNFQLINKYDFLSIKNSNDSISSEDVPEKKKNRISLGIFHEINFMQNSRKFNDENIDEYFYSSNNIYIDSSATSDKTTNRKLENKIGISTQISSKVNIKVYIENELLKYRYDIPNDSIFSEIDTVVNTTVVDNINNNFFGSNLFLSNEFIKLESNFKYCFQGYRKSDLFWYNSISKKIGLNNIIDLVLNYSDIKPDYFYSNYSSNNYQWNNNFEKQKISDINLRYYNKKIRLSVETDLRNIRNYIYFDNNCEVKQYTEDINIVSFKLHNYLKIRNFHLHSKVVLQKSSNEDIIQIPRISTYNSFYYQYNFIFKQTNGSLLSQFGFDVNYFSSYYAQQYNPISGIFYNQNINKIGNYPIIDVFVNFKVKRTRFFLKYSHANYGISNGYYLSTPYYPIPRRMFKFGLSWVFYN